MERIEKAALCEIHAIAGIGSRALWRILTVCGSFVSFYQAEVQLLRSILSPETTEALIRRRSSRISWKALERLENQGFSVLSVLDEGYPHDLKSIYDPPFILYSAGFQGLLNSFCLGIVGSRNATPYGKKVARRLAEELAGNGAVIVSGMARGIDAQAHYGALNAGATIAVLGSGLNVIYPRDHTGLYERICREGLVVSEFPLDTPPEPGHFPMRNRIISGLSRGIVVVEAKERSGALITADLALDQGREVYAVPGPITHPNSLGTNRLIQQGAKLITHAGDVLEDYPDVQPGSSRLGQPAAGELFSAEEGEEAEILQWIDEGEIHYNDLLQRSGLDHGTLSTVLLKLELKGIVTSTPGNYYVKIR